MRSYLFPCANEHVGCSLNRAGGREMEAKYNWIIDSTPIRIAINLAAFTVWISAAFGLMFIAVK